MGTVPLGWRECRRYPLVPNAIVEKKACKSRPTTPERKGCPPVLLDHEFLSLGAQELKDAEWVSEEKKLVTPRWSSWSPIARKWWCTSRSFEHTPGYPMLPDRTRVLRVLA